MPNDQYFDSNLEHWIGSGGDQPTPEELAWREKYKARLISRGGYDDQSAQLSADCAEYEADEDPESAADDELSYAQEDAEEDLSQ